MKGGKGKKFSLGVLFFPCAEDSRWYGDSAGTKRIDPN